MKMNRARLLGEEGAIHTLWTNNNFDCSSDCRERRSQGGERVTLQIRKRCGRKLRTDNKVTGNEARNARLDAKVAVCVHRRP